jgi:hypothetical protein
MQAAASMTDRRMLLDAPVFIVSPEGISAYEVAPTRISGD